MNCVHLWTRPLRAMAVAMLMAASAAPFAADEPLHSGNQYRAGPTVRIVEPVAGDLLAAGGHIVVERSVARDAAIAGGDVTVRWRSPAAAA